MANKNNVVDIELIARAGMVSCCYMGPPFDNGPPDRRIRVTIPEVVNRFTISNIWNFKYTYFFFLTQNNY